MQIKANERASSAVVHATSTLTSRSQTTIPATIRDALHLKAGELIRYALLPNGEVRLYRHQEEEEDPVLLNFLSFLGRDMQENPQHIKPLPADFFECIEELTGGLVVDLDGPL